MRRPRSHPWSVAAPLVVLAAIAGGCDSGRSDPSATATSSLIDAPPANTQAASEPGHGDDDPPPTASTSDRPGRVELSAAASVCWTSSPAEGDGVKFADVTEQIGLLEPLTGMYGHATGVGDVDADGWLDLFVAGFADRPIDDYRSRGASGPTPDRLLLGGPDGFSVDPTFQGELARTSGAVFADLTDDGQLEIVAVRNPRGDTEIGRRATVIHRRTDAGWDVVAVPLPGVAGRAAAATDLDRDGHLDLIVLADRWGGGSTTILRNLGGDGRPGDLEFEDVTSEWGVPDDMTGLALATVDLDGNGWIDLVVSGDERVLLGGPDGFQVERHELLSWEVFGAEDDPAGIAVGDLDDDGRPDMVIGQHFNSTLEVDERVPVRVFLNRSDADGLRLVDVTEESGSPGLWTKSPHVAIVDVDNDGWPDIVTSAVAADGRPLVLRSTGLDDAGVPRLTPIGEPGDGRYWVTGSEMDIDRDGRVDVFFVEWEPSLASPAFVNGSASGRWLHVNLGDTPGAAAGTRVDVSDATSGDRIATAWVASSTGYASGAAPVVRFGLGDGRGDADVRVDVTPVGSPTETQTVPVNGHVRWSGC